MAGRDVWGLEARGTNTALIDAKSGRHWSYEALHARVMALASELRAHGPERKLVFVAAAIDVGSITAYLAALAADSPVLLLDRHAHATLLDDLVARYRPDCLLRAHGDEVEVSWQRGDKGRALHPELSLLLSTSGTTGSPKLVRLSRTNLVENARSIGRYLGLDASERAISSLPFHYSYGLSVLNSHLLAGGSLVVSDESVLRPELWEAMRVHGCTSFAGVPYSYQIMRRIGFEKRELPSLHTLTQAGGRLPPQLVSYYHGLMAARGGRFFTMYGQTEATARISYLPPERVPDKAGSIGIAIPGGQLSIMDGEREIEAPERRGELVYRGPNVMLGYATSAEELSLPDTQGGVLRTGDLGYRDAEGFFYVTGRIKRFAKVYGLRVNLDEVEERVRREGPCAAVSDDERITLFCEQGDTATFEALKIELAQIYQLNLNTFRFERIDALPLLASGKIDYDALQQRPR